MIPRMWVNTGTLLQGITRQIAHVFILMRNRNGSLMPVNTK